MAVVRPLAVPVTLALACCTLLSYQSEFGSARVEVLPRITEEARSAVPEAHLRVDMSLVLVPVQVTTPDGSPILNLKRDAFRVLEDGVEQEISYFAQDDAPVSVGLLFDASASMKEKKQKAVDAVDAFFKTATQQDEFFLIEFEEEPRLKVPFTSDSAELSDAVRRVRPYGRTTLYDAIYMAVRTMKKAAHDRKALVVVSDGADNHSRQNFGTVRSLMLESDAQLYAMGIFAPERASEQEEETAEEARGPGVLDQLAEMTGGRHFAVSLDNLKDISARIGTLLRNRYLVGYTSSNPMRDGKYRRVTVEVAAPAGEEFRVQYRRGYYAPAR